jgi:hypothetical protein
MVGAGGKVAREKKYPSDREDDGRWGLEMMCAACRYRARELLLFRPESDKPALEDIGGKKVVSSVVANGRYGCVRRKMGAIDLTSTAGCGRLRAPFTRPAGR